MADVGRPSQLDDEQFLLKIRELYLDGKNEKEIAEILDIPLNTWNFWKWKNYQSFNDVLLSYKHERMLRKAEVNIEVLQDSEDERVNLQANTFVLETLGKKNYSKKSETDLTSGGEKILVVPQVVVDRFNLNGTNEETTGVPSEQ